jgi:hypothetical protein
MMKSLADYREYLSRKRGEQELIAKQVGKLKTDLECNKELVEDWIEAKRVVQEVALLTQQSIAEYIESTVSLAIQSVYQDRDYRFIVEYILKPSRTDVELKIQKGDKEPYYPKDEQAGGLLDIISFALRVVVWSIQPNRSRPILVLDEPFKYLQSQIHVAGKMLKEVSQKAGLQIIMVANWQNLELASIADRLWSVMREADKTIVRRMEEGIEKGATPFLQQRRKKRDNDNGEES